MDTPKLWYYPVCRASQYRILKHINFGHVRFKTRKLFNFWFHQEINHRTAEKVADESGRNGQETDLSV
jgi:hypothetical protein